MLFNSIEFAIFLPIVFILYWFFTSKNLKLQNLLLLFSSYFFYGWWDWRFLTLIVFSSSIDYIVGIKLGNEKGKTSLTTTQEINENDNSHHFLSPHFFPAIFFIVLGTIMKDVGRSSISTFTFFWKVLSRWKFKPALNIKIWNGKGEPSITNTQEISENEQISPFFVQKCRIVLNT